MGHQMAIFIHSFIHSYTTLLLGFMIPTNDLLTQRDAWLDVGYIDPVCLENTAPPPMSQHKV